jgi:hypothetical protein
MLASNNKESGQSTDWPGSIFVAKAYYFKFQWEASQLVILISCFFEYI